jgi:Family of unknown function (DUF6510)
MDDRVALMQDDPAVDLTVDGSGVGGLLASVFGREMTIAPGQCAHCHTISVLGAMRAYTRGPGIVLRCPACSEVVVRIVQTPRGIRLDARGATYLVVNTG